MPSTNPSLSPLIKWSGGKRNEIPLIKDAYPQHIDRVVEPFSGGAAVSFDLNPSQIVLNDVSEGLVHFYQGLQAPASRQRIVDFLDAIHQLRRNISAACQALSDADVQAAVGNKKWGQHTWLVQQLAVWSKVFPHHKAQLAQDIEKSLASKMGTRIPNLEKKAGHAFDVANRRDHLETAIQAGVYTFLRRVYNNHINLSKEDNIGAWFVVRSLCYSGMFRYGASGDFNVPYGGIGYNSRDFQSSIRSFSNPDVVDFLTRSHIHQMDFEDLFKHYHNFGPHDFVFVDPPYDSAFSQYNADQDFSVEDQKRLAKALMSLNAPWMLVIKNTPFILGLYQDPSLHRGVFGKTYQVNFRNRHDRGVEHLVVTNYAYSSPHITSI